MRNKPNLPPQAPCPTQKMRNKPNLPRGGPVEDQKYETNPISPRPTTRLHETNPISARRIYETNPIPIETPNLRTTNHQLRTIMRNEPNSRIPSAPPPPISAKRTQFIIPPTSHRHLFRETNPICPTSTITHRNYAKRTQFPTTNIHSTIYNIQSLAPIYPTIYNPQYTIYNPLAQFPHQCGLNANGGHYFSTWRRST